MTERPLFVAIEWHLVLNTPELSTADVVVRRSEKLIGTEMEQPIRAAS